LAFSASSASSRCFVVGVMMPRSIASTMPEDPAVHLRKLAIAPGR
jgi:hypothetical protein